VATTLLVAGPTLTWAGLGFHPPARTQASFKGARLLFPLMHMSCDDHAVQLITFEWAMAAKRRQNIII